MDDMNDMNDIEETRLGDPLICDMYHLTQARTIFKEGDPDLWTVHDYFFRKVPWGSYILVAGLENVLKHLQAFQFTDDDINYIKQIDKRAKDDYLEYLRHLKFTGDIWAMPEGSLAFPKEPIIRVEGPWLQTWIIESAILHMMNYPSLVATKASRMVYAAQGRPVADFGLRRSPGDGAAVESARSAFIGGFFATSNVRAAKNLGIQPSGTMSHELVQAYFEIYGSEIEAFRVFARQNPENCILLIDTIDTEQGAKNMLIIAEEQDGKGYKVNAVRLDSGNLGELAKKVRSLDSPGNLFSGIMASSDIDEFRILQFLGEGAPFTGFGIGTKLTAPNPAALGGVYKLAVIEVNGEFRPTIKLSEETAKTTLPGRKTVLRSKNEQGLFGGDKICLTDEVERSGLADGFEIVLKKVMAEGKIIGELPSLKEIRAEAETSLSALPDEHRKITNPSVYPVEISEQLTKLQEALIQRFRR